MILDIVPRLNKKLNHLVVVTESGRPSLEELARVVIWTLVAGVPYISFHDVTGELKQNEEKLFHEVERNKKGIPGCIKWSKKPDLNGYSNGLQAHRIVVNILTQDDGRPKIADCIKQIASGTIPCKRTSEEFTAQELDNALAHVYSAIPDPDVVLYIGPLCCTYGLLPWHIRLSEFIQLKSVSLENYISALVAYSQCNQRFGK
ncbi:dehydrodolichyl diphosphate synthase complex subunit nus1 [Phthorimaea operculella]|nr:dehydrodolichyl diphosphate synthase complex subunit nus1 [Phthorimaea operculella]